MTEKLRRPGLHAVPMSQMSLTRAGFKWEPNWIDYRASRARIDRRVEKGELPERCGECFCETDVDPAPHSPRCSKAVT